MLLPVLYPILDSAILPNGAARQQYLSAIGSALAQAGVTLLQYRNKHDSDAQVLEDAQTLRAQAPASLSILLNDRAHLVLPAQVQGVHLGQSDLPIAEARALLGPDAIIGLSTHNPAELAAATTTPASYLAIGPIYPTTSKQNPEPVTGLEGIRQARALTSKPLVAIGGITPDRAAEALEAGATTVAVISAIFPQGATPAQSAKLAKDFLARFR